METDMNRKIRVSSSTSHKEIKNLAAEMIADLALEDSFVICNLGEIIQKHLEWTKFIPRVKPFYAVKCNDDEHILKTLANLGTGFDCASKGEMARAMEMGAKPSDIIFAHPTKSLAHLRYAKAQGINLMTFDNEEELRKIKKLHPAARLVVRMKCDNEVARILFGDKFGIYESELARLLEIAINLDLDVVGVSFHIGAGCNNPVVYREAIQASRRIFDSAKNDGFNLTLLDLGGGFPGHDIKLFEAVAEIVNSSLDEFFPEDCGVTVVAEPGRYYATSANYLIAQLHSIRKVEKEDMPTSYMYYINDGLYSSLATAWVEPCTGIPDRLLLDRRASELVFQSCIWGQSCYGGDIVCHKALLPKLEIGEWLIFKNNGSYSRSFSTNFNGFPPPKTYYVADIYAWDFLKSFIEENNFIMDKNLKPPQATISEDGEVKANAKIFLSDNNYNLGVSRNRSMSLINKLQINELPPLC